MNNFSNPKRLALVLLTAATISPSALAAQAQQTAPTVTPAIGSADDTALVKLDPRLRAAVPAGPQLQSTPAATVMVDVFGRPGSGAAATPFFEKSIVRRMPGRQLFDQNLEPSTADRGLNLEVVSGVVRTDRLLKIASLRSVDRVLKMGAPPPAPPQPSQPETNLAVLQQRVRAMRDGTLQGPPSAQRTPSPNGWFEQSYVDWKRAWAAGYTGKGVDVAVLDSGIDFAHPDLEGLQARVSDSASPYFYQVAALSKELRTRFPRGVGLPMAFDGTSLINYLLDRRNSVGNWSFYINTSRRFQPGAGSVTVDGIAYRLPSIARGEVRVGFSSDNSLRSAWTEPDSPSLAKIAILLTNTGKVDLDRNGKFDDLDTVYTDINSNLDFSDDKPAFLGDEVMRWDGDGDGLADLSGGMLYFIADGRHPIPAADWLYGGVVSESLIVPQKGDLVALMVDDPTEPGGKGHGTRCASAVVSKAVINGNASALKLPSSGPGDGIVQAASKDTHLIAAGNLYAGGSLLDWYQFIFFGYDGKADGPQANGDDPQLVNMSFGFTYEATGYDVESRLLGILNRFFNPYVLLGHSAGNGGPGIGTINGPNPWTALTVGASTQYNGQNESTSLAFFEQIMSLDQATYGDITPFSNWGPDSLGTAGVDIAGNGAWGTGDMPLNEATGGATAWELWGGTSRAAPTVLGSLSPAYQGWRARTGRWPSYREARDLAMSSATYTYHPPHSTGAGISNAGRVTLAAAGVEGMIVSPASWTAGSYRGSDKQDSGQSNLLLPDQTASKTFTVSNPSPRSQRLTLRDAALIETGQPISGELTTIDQADEKPSVGKPDYLVRLAPQQIPADTDLMVVRSLHSFESFNANDDAEADSVWRLLAYDWTDLDGDGQLWADRNGNGYVDGVADDTAKIKSDELDVGEYNRFGYSYAAGPTQDLRISRPHQRSHDGIFIGWEHRFKSTLVPRTTLRYEVRFYKLSDWNLVGLNKTSLYVPARGNASFVATLSAANTSPGYHEGYILADAAGSGAFARVAHLSPDTPAVDVYVDGTKALSGVSYRQISHYLPLTAGSHRIQITPAGRSPAGAAVDTIVRLEDGSQYTIAAAGTLAASDAAPLAALLIADENYQAPNDQAKLRVVHSAANADPVDVYVGAEAATDQRPGQSIAAGLSFGRASQYLLLKAGQAEVRIFQAGADPTRTHPLYEMALRLEAGRTVNLFAAGDAARPSTLRLAIQYSNRQLAYAPHTTAIPVNVNIGRTLGASSAEPVQLGGSRERAQTIYDNSFVYGTIKWDGGGNVDDNRRYLLDAPDSLAGSYLLTHTSWGDDRPTDIDTLLLGPQDQPCEQWFDPCDDATRAAYEAEAGSAVLGMIGGSGRNGSNPVWRFGTATGDSEDWGSALIRPGLHQVLNDNVLTAGRNMAIPFTTTVGTATVTPTTLEGSGSSASFNVSLRSSLSLPGGIRGVGFGLAQPRIESLSWTSDNLSPKLFPFNVRNGGLINITTDSTDVRDIDIYLFYDANGDGTFAPAEVIANSVGASAAEQISVRFPRDGSYLLLVDNFSQTVGSAQARLSIIQGGGVTLSGLPTTTVPAGELVSFNVQVSGAPTGDSEGILFVGPVAIPTAFVIPIHIRN